MSGKAHKIEPSQLKTQTLEWGAIKWFVTPTVTEGAGFTFGEVVVLPDGGHARHNHPDAEELLYFLSGEGEQMLDDERPFPVHAGDVIYIPAGVFHSTLNTGWAPLRILAVYNPGGSELALADLPDFKELPAGSTPAWQRR